MTDIDVVAPLLSDPSVSLPEPVIVPSPISNSSTGPARPLATNDDTRLPHQSEVQLGGPSKPPSATIPTPPNPDPTNLKRKREEDSQECTACNRKRGPLETLDTPCGHPYCRKCILRLFKNAVANESSYPPQCCHKAILLDDARQFLDPTLVDDFEMKSREYSTADRTYCSKPTCSAFIYVSAIDGNVATCVCGHKTCIVCKSEAHPAECPEDPTTKEVLELAKAENWQQCGGCNRVIEHTFGCNHMT